MKLSGTYAQLTKSQFLTSLCFLLVGVLVAWQLGEKIIAGDTTALSYAAIAFGGCAAIVVILRNWRTGFYTFFVWMMFEDLVRKYMGNGLALFFLKDVLLGFTYASFYAAIRKGREKPFRPPFLAFLSLFFWLGLLQMFNPNSPSIWYGLLGMKVYFYYVPLLFLGYALIRSDDELIYFLKLNALIALPICAVGIAQSVLGNSFLNPANLAPDLQELGNLQKYTMSGQAFNLPDSVFVSSGRYGNFLAVAFILLLGAAGYLLLHTKRYRSLIFVAIGCLGVSALLSGGRGLVLTLLMTVVILSAGFVWSASPRPGQGRRILKAIRRVILVTAGGLALLFFLYPEQAATRVDFYTETLLPNGGDFELGTRSWDYPLQNFIAAFSRPNWVFGNGIGTSTLGTQYVARLTGKPAPPIAVEEGFGTMIVEMGIIAPFLWILWTGFLLYHSWKVIRSLRGTRFFPIALAIGWYAFALLCIWTYGSLDAYENYTCCAYLWLLVGLLFRLPELHTSAVYSSLLNQKGRA